MQTAKFKRKSNIILFAGMILLFSVVSIAAANVAFLITDKIYHGVQVGNIDVGGLSVAQAEEKILSHFEKQLDKSLIKVKYDSSSWEINPQELDFKVDAMLAARHAFNVGRTGNIFNQFKERYIAVNRGRVLPVPLIFNQDKLRTALVNISRVVDRESVNATIAISGSEIVIVSEIIGRRANIDATLDLIEKQLAYKMPVFVDLNVTEIVPAVTSRDLSGINAVLASYTTQFDPKDVNRTENIKLAAKSLDNILVRSKESFSFNNQVGPRLAKFGYKEAPVFVNGKLLPDFGGGVCQVSSTLYNVILLADLEVEERTAHFRPPGYVPIGQDATVADNLLDFKFKNNSNNNIYLKTEVNHNTITVTVFGHQTKRPYEISIAALEKKVLEPATIIKQDPELELGKEIVESEGQKGFNVTTYRIKIKNHQEISREMIGSDEYKPVDRVIRVGTKSNKTAVIK